jgi:hypothetical protein
MASSLAAIEFVSPEAFSLSLPQYEVIPQGMKRCGVQFALFAERDRKLQQVREDRKLQTNQPTTAPLWLLDPFF